MAKTLHVIERELGERCCDPGARPRIGNAAAERLAADLQLIGHPIRIQLLDMLARNAGKVCVCDLEGNLPVKQPTVSHHLRILREGGLVDAEKQGQWMYYHVRGDALRALRTRVAQHLDALS